MHWAVRDMLSGSAQKSGFQGTVVSPLLGTRDNAGFHMAKRSHRRYRVCQRVSKQGELPFVGRRRGSASDQPGVTGRYIPDVTFNRPSLKAEGGGRGACDDTRR